METKNLIIQLFPTYESIAKTHGLDPNNDDADGDAIGALQGNDIVEIECEPCDQFEITSTDFEFGNIFCDEIDYKLIKKDFNGTKEIIEKDIEKYIRLEPGKYLFHTDGITIEQLSAGNED